MKLLPLFLIGLATASAAASEHKVPAEFLGTWASTAADCIRKGNTSLRISDTEVELFGSLGFINAGAIPGSKSIEVIFKPINSRATGRNVRTFVLSTDGTKLYEQRGDQWVATRTKCVATAK